MSNFISISIIFFLSFTLYTTSSQNTSHVCHQKDAELLLKIRSAFGNPTSLASWNLSTDCCRSWESIGCNFKERKVTSFVVFEDPTIRGPIPWLLGNLTTLTDIRIFDNRNLAGTIPKSLCDLPNLEFLILSGNKLSGSIPDCFRKNIAYLKLSNNRLFGTIPDNFLHGVDNTFRQTVLFLDHNRLSGQIPKSLGDVPLTLIDLSYNRLTGDASFLLGAGKNYPEFLDFSHNELKFDLTNTTFSLRLQMIDLNHNNIYGSLPKQLSNIGMLKSFNVSHNNLCGPIPTAGFMKNFDKTAFAHNKCLCGGPLEPCH